MNIIEWIQSLLTNRALDAEIADDVCVACDSDDLNFLAERVYRCNMCGYEGGSGWAEFKQDRQRAGYDELGPVERHDKAVEKLDEARTLVMSGIGDLDGALKASRMDVYSDNEQYDQEKHDDLLACFRLFTEADELIEDAVYLLDASYPDRPDVTDVMNVAMDSMNNLFDSRLFDGGLHAKIKQARQEAEALLRWCHKTADHARNNPPKPEPQQEGGAW